eukprot:TRINITY_DN3313_c0_g2_i1.p1 TRINITY_DN3313_c0_g2~~TRINITY_DN3313_c0_g2_i1.p1  ORF type:complete len:257 (+),score=16.17 TRINITY_DN3313_c0_g2_i1:92-772(+)
MVIPGRFLAVLTLWHSLLFEFGESQLLSSLELHGNASIGHTGTGRALSGRRRARSYVSETEEESGIPIPLICRTIALVGQVGLFVGAIVVLKMSRYQQHATIMARACMFGSFLFLVIGIMVPFVVRWSTGDSAGIAESITGSADWMVILAIGNVICTMLGHRLRRMSHGGMRSVGEPIVVGAADPAAAPMPAPFVLEATVVSTPAPVPEATVVKEGVGAREDGIQV